MSILLGMSILLTMSILLDMSILLSMSVVVTMSILGAATLPHLPTRNLPGAGGHQEGWLCQAHGGADDVHSSRPRVQGRHRRRQDWLGQDVCLRATHARLHSQAATHH